MGNRAYLSIYLGKEHFSKDLMAYKELVDDFYDEWFDLSDDIRDSRKDDLINLAIEVFDIDDTFYILPIVPNLETYVIGDQVFFSNHSLFGEFSRSSLDKKNNVPLEWCSLFTMKDIIKNKNYRFKGREIKGYPYQFRTTVEQALERAKQFSSAEYLVKFLERYPGDGIVVLNFSEFYMNENFNDKDIFDTVKIFEFVSTH